jgi:hypothetical protein
MILTLQPDEVQVCQMVGRMRSLIARGNGVRDAKMGNQDGSEADVMGMMAEYGFAKKMNVFPIWDLRPEVVLRMELCRVVSVMTLKHPSIKLLDCFPHSK